MKRVIVNIAILALVLILIGGIIYLGQYFTKLKLNNKTLLNSLEISNQNSFSSFSEAFKQINDTIGSFKQTWGDFFVLLPKLSTDLKLRETLTATAKDFEIIQNGEFLAEIVKDDNQSKNSLDILLDLNQNLNLLEKYNLNFVRNLQYQIKNWLIFLGNDSPKNYLIIFQEPNVPRPSGGFFGAYGIISFNQGKMTLKGGSIFDLDDLFLNKIIPPSPLQTIGNKWFFHDVNWFFDFSSTSKKIIEFYQKTGLTPSVDGVIAVNDSIFEPILNITGQIELKDYGLVVDKNNFVSFFENQIENSAQSILGEARKKVLAEGEILISQGEGREIFSMFIQSLFNKLQETPSEQFAQIFNIFEGLLKNKDIQIYSSNDEVESYFDSLGWAGKITESKNDYLAVVFNSIEKGFTKDKRQKNINLETKISSSTITDILKINAQSLSLKDKNLETFLKIYLPKGVTIIDSTGGYLKKINNDWPYDKLGYQNDSDLEIIESKKNIDESKGIEIFEEGSKTVIGTWVKLSLKPFSLTYQLPFQGEDLNNWEIKIQKQSGQNVNLSYNLILPSDKKIIPTLFEFQKSFLLIKDIVLNFQID
ncbi:MAG: DUF4012 domain-containing protein [Candidatus Paceibacterota bacterium]|jgi:hypothetical protein